MEKPYLSCGYRIENDSIVFMKPSEEIKISEHVSEIRTIVSLCNSMRTWQEISSFADMASDLVYTISATLLTHRIVLPVTQLYSQFHELSQYPLLVGGETTVPTVEKQKGVLLSAVPKLTIQSLLRRRVTVRDFSRKPLTEAELSAMLQSAYGTVEGRRTTPSAGGMYELAIHVCLLTDTGRLAAGVYKYNPSHHTLIRTRREISRDLATVILNDARIAQSVPCLVFISSRCGASNRKYPNRAYRFQLIEAGHIAQNAYLTAPELGLGVVECGGFQDELIAEILGLKCYPNEGTLLILGIGHPSTEVCTSSIEYDSAQMQEILASASDHIIGVRYSTYQTRHYHMPRMVAYCEYPVVGSATGKKTDGACGVGSTIAESTVKAVAEALERHAAGYLRIDKVARPSDLESRLDLEEGAPISNAYKAQEGLHIHTNDAQREWVRGTRVTTNETVWLPSDQVFYPFDTKVAGRSTSYYASSNGVAAHITHTEAVARGFYELLERDALCVHWYGRMAPKKVCASYLTTELQERVRAFERATRTEVIFRDMTLDSFPIMCALISAKHGGMVLGTACSPDPALALTKALDEAELGYHHLKREKDVYLPPDAVKQVKDHARFWWQAGGRQGLEWFLNTSETSRPRKELMLPEELTRFKVVNLSLDLPNYTGKIVIRKTASPNLVPITFGVGSEHYGHKRLLMLGLYWVKASLYLPHPLA